MLEFSYYELRWRAHTQHLQEGNWANEERWARQIKRENEDRESEEGRAAHRSEELSGNAYVYFLHLFTFSIQLKEIGSAPRKRSVILGWWSFLIFGSKTNFSDVKAYPVPIEYHQFEYPFSNYLNFIEWQK